MSPLKAALLSATLLAAIGGGVAAAQVTPQSAPVYDPAQLPAIKGHVAQYSLTPRGDVDGVILDDGTEVHMPPHLSAALVFAVRPGDAITIHGLKARALPMVMAMSITNDATNATVVDAGPPGPHEAQQTLQAQGTVKEALHGPRGEVNGALLNNGTIIRLPPDFATKMAPQLAVGQALFVRGPGNEGPLGRVIAAREIGPSETQLTQVPEPHGMFGEHMMHMMHDMHGGHDAPKP